MARLRPHAHGTTALALPLLLWLLRAAQGATGNLSEEELRMVFRWRDTAPRYYDLFEPRLAWEGGGRDAGVGKRSRYARHSTTTTNAAAHQDSPILKFRAMGRTFNFRLHPNRDLVSSHFAFLGRRGEEVEVRGVNEGDLNCYYHGFDPSGTHDHDDDDSSANATTIAVELCGRVRGVISGPTEEYVIEPLPDEIIRRRRRRSSPAPGTTHVSHTHIIYAREVHAAAAPERMSRRRRSFLASGGGVGARAVLGEERTGRRSYYDSYEHVVDSHLRAEWDDYTSSFGREEKTSRDSSDLYIEISVFVDHDLYRHMLENFPTDTENQVLQVVLAMVNAVQLLYNDDSLGHRVKFVLKRLEILYTDPPGLQRPYDIDLFLTKFCTWQRGENPPQDDDPLHWDHALILTGLDVFAITDTGKVNAQVVGLAPVAGMCTRSSSCTVNEGRHFESVYVMAHEIGHNLGMHHDGLQAGNNCDPGRYLMSPTLGSGKITWSSCSRRYLDTFLRSPQSSCLLDPAAPKSQQMDHEASALPGQRFPADQQCMLKHGAGSYHAPSQTLDDICEDMHCRRDHYTWTSHPALEGTTCGNHKWCRRGSCVEDPDAPGHPMSSLLSSSASSSIRLSPGAQDGGAGGEWGAWSECRSQCLYGVDGALSSGSSGLALSERRCRTCQGEYRYRLCSAAEECGTGQRKTVQDFAHDTCRSRARTSSHLTGLAVRLPARGPTQCEVECETKDRGVEASDRSFPEGTVCQSASSFPAFCVAGVCTEFRCEPDALYGADPVTCRPDMGAPDPHRPLGPHGRPHPGTLTTTRQTITYNTREPQWGAWRPASTCRFSCLTPAKGIQLVSRKCRDRGCFGVNRNIQVCTPDEPHECDRLKTPFEYASEVCRRFKLTVSKLSGVGMQLASTQDDPDRSCTVACQDIELDYRFYRVKGRDGWFPFGTECSRDHGVRHSYCLNGRCLDFSDEGTPLRNTIYTEYEKSRASELEPIERAFPLEVRASPWRRLRRRDVTSASHPIASTLSDHLLLTLVDQINHTMTSRGRMAGEIESSIDLRNPLFVSQMPPTAAEGGGGGGGGGGGDEGTGGDGGGGYTVTLKPNSYTLTPLNPRPHSSSLSGQSRRVTLSGSSLGAFDEEVPAEAEYLWQLVVSPCSVTCGRGLEEVSAACVRAGSGEAVEAWRCAPDPPPQDTGYRACQQERTCPDRPPDLASTVIGRWLMAMLRGVSDGDLL